jgi:hypothetical protein
MFRRYELVIIAPSVGSYTGLEGIFLESGQRIHQHHEERMRERNIWRFTGLPPEDDAVLHHGIAL